MITKFLITEFYKNKAHRLNLNQTGVAVVFCDANIDYNMKTESVETLITSSAKSLMPD